MTVKISVNDDENSQMHSSFKLFRNGKLSLI